MNFLLGKGKAKLVSSTRHGNRDVSLLTANKLMFSITFFNRSKAILFSASLGSLKLYDKYTEGTKFELIMAPSKEYISDGTKTVVSEIRKDEKDFLKVCVEVNTPTKPVDHFIGVELEPLNFVYNSKVIQRIRKTTIIITKHSHLHAFIYLYIIMQ